MVSLCTTSAITFDKTTKKASGYSRFLDIERGIGGVDYSDKAGTKYERRYFSSAPDDVVAAHYKATGANKLHLRFALVAGEDINASDPKYDNNGEAFFAGKLPTVYYNARMKVVPTGGTMTRDEGRCGSEGCHRSEGDFLRSFYL